MNRKALVRVMGLVAVLLGIGALVLWLYPFRRLGSGPHVRVEGQLVSQHTARPLTGVCVVLNRWVTAEQAADWCSRLRAGKWQAEYEVPEGEGAIFNGVGMTDAEGRFRLHSVAHWPISKNLLGMRFGPDAPDLKYWNKPMFLLREGAEPVQVPVPDGEWRELAPGAEVLLRRKGYFVLQEGTEKPRRVPFAELPDLPVVGVVDLGSIPVAIEE